MLRSSRAISTRSRSPRTSLSARASSRFRPLISTEIEWTLPSSTIPTGGLLSRSSSSLRRLEHSSPSNLWLKRLDPASRLVASSSRLSCSHTDPYIKSDRSFFVMWNVITTCLFYVHSCNMYVCVIFCSCHRPCWSTDRLLRHFNGYFRLYAGICSAISNMLKSSGISVALRTLSRSYTYHWQLLLSVISTYISSFCSDISTQCLIASFSLLQGSI